MKNLIKVERAPYSYNHQLMKSLNWKIPTGNKMSVAATSGLTINIAGVTSALYASLT